MAATRSKKTSPDPPCLFLSGQEWERLAERIEDPFFARLHESNLRVLDAMAAESETPADHRLPGQQPLTSSRGLKNRLLRQIVAWYITRREDYLEAARRTLQAACDSWAWWAPGSETGGIRCAGLHTGELMHVVSFGHDALYPYLDDDLRRHCMSALIDKGLAAYLAGIEVEDWWVKCDFNWNSALHGNAGLAALAIRQADPHLSEQALKLAVDGLPHLIKSFLPGGGYIEGVMYLGTAVGHLTDFVAPLYRLTGDDLGLTDNRDLEDTLTFQAHMCGGDGRTYNISDVNEGQAALLPHVFWWARRFGRPDLTWVHENWWRPAGRRSGLFHDIESFWYREPFQESQPPPHVRLRHYPTLDWLTYHGEHTWLAFRSGFNGGNHDNDDLGHFILGMDAERFLVDPGYGATLASQHNCITIRHQEQTDGATARIARIEELEGGFYLLCDASEAFPFVLNHYHRHLLLIDDAHLLLLDDICGREPIRNDMRGYLQTRLPAYITADGFRIQGRRDALEVKFLSDVGGLQSDQWHHKRTLLTRLSWSDAYYRVHSVQPILLTFGEPDFSHELTADGFRLTLDGRTYSFETGNEGFRFRGVAP